MRTAVPRHSVLKANVRQQLKERLNMSSLYRQTASTCALVLPYLVVVTNELPDPRAEVYRIDLQGKAAEVNRLLLDVRRSSFRHICLSCRLLGQTGHVQLEGSSTATTGFHMHLQKQKPPHLNCAVGVVEVVVLCPQHRPHLVVVAKVQHHIPRPHR